MANRGFSTRNTIHRLYFFALFIAVCGFIMVSAGPFSSTYQVRTYAPDVGGLSEKDEVRLQGVPVGRVEQIRLDGDRVEVVLDIDEEVKLKTDTVASIPSTPPGGKVFVNLTQGSGDSPALMAGNVIQWHDTPSMSQMLGEMKRLTDKMDTLRVEISAGDTLPMPPEDSDLAEAFRNIARMSEKLAEGEGTLGKLLDDDSLYNEARDLMGSMQETFDTLNKGEGTLGKFLKDEKTYTDLSDTLADVKDIVQRVNDGEGTLGKLVQDDTLYNDGKDVVETAKEILDGVKNGEGTLGKLVTDETLHDRALTAIERVDSAVEGFEDQSPLSTIGTVLGVMF